MNEYEGVGDEGHQSDRTRLGSSFELWCLTRRLVLVVHTVNQFLPLYFKTVFCCNHLFVCAQCAMQEKLVCTWAAVGECRDFPSCTACV
jgi:hypothetical protein